MRIMRFTDSHFHGIVHAVLSKVLRCVRGHFGSSAKWYQFLGRTGGYFAMNKVVIMSFVMIVGAVLIGVPLWGAFHPNVMPEYDQMAQNVNASADAGALTTSFTNTQWSVSHNVIVGGVPVVFDLEFHFQPGEKLLCKAHLFADTPLSPQYEALKPLLETGWEGKWRVLENGAFLKVESVVPYKGYEELEAVSPFRIENIRIEGGNLVYSPTGQINYVLNKM